MGKCLMATAGSLQLGYRNRAPRRPGCPAKAGRGGGLPDRVRPGRKSSVARHRCDGAWQRVPHHLMERPDAYPFLASSGGRRKRFWLDEITKELVMMGSRSGWKLNTTTMRRI